MKEIEILVEVYDEPKKIIEKLENLNIKVLMKQQMYIIMIHYVAI